MLTQHFFLTTPISPINAHLQEMSTATIIVLCPNGRRATVKISTNGPLLNVLQQVCSKQGYNADEHELRRGKNVVDLSVSFRYSGLTNNAKLDLVRSQAPRKPGGEVTVLIQTEGGRREQGMFSTSATLWEVMEGLGLTDPAHSQEDVPAIVYMRQRVTGEQELTGTTLGEMGVTSGRVSLRLLYTKPVPGVTAEEHLITSNNTSGCGQLSTDDTHNEGKEEVKSKPVGCHDDMGDIQFPVLPFSVFPSDTPALEEHMEVDMPTNDDDTPTDQTVTTPILQEDTPTNNTPPALDTGESFLGDNATRLLINYIKQTSSTDQQPVVYDGPCDRRPVVYCNDDQVSVPIAEVSDEFFEPTIDDVARRQEELRRQVNALTNAPLRTQQQRDTGKGRSYVTTVIRVMLPDHWVLQGTFNSGESLKTLVMFVRDHLRDEDTKFHLYTTPPKQVLRSSKDTFASKGFLPAANMHLGVEGAWQGCGQPLPLLSDTSIAQYRRDPLQADVIASETRPQTVHKQEVGGANGDTVKTHPDPLLINKATPTSTRTPPTQTGQPKLPKWFKPK